MTIMDEEDRKEREEQIEIELREELDEMLREELYAKLWDKHEFDYREQIIEEWDDEITKSPQKPRNGSRMKS